MPAAFDMPDDTATLAESEPAAGASAFERAVKAGLSGRIKTLDSKYFYDPIGSALFDRICELEEYYPTRTETKILRRCAPAVAAVAGPGAELVELGSGSSLKTCIVLAALDRPAAYIPVDISDAHMLGALHPLRAQFPELEIRPVFADFTVPFALPARRGEGARLLFFPGSTIGNLHPAEAEDFLARLRRDFAPRALLIGVDLKKDEALLHAAYNDALGVTAAFNLNILERIGRDLDADMRPDCFRHEARYVKALGRIEMHLVCTEDHMARVGDLPIRFRRGETIHTENSYKYTLAEFTALAGRAGWRPEAEWTDENNLFAVHLLAAV